MVSSTHLGGQGLEFETDTTQIRQGEFGGIIGHQQLRRALGFEPPSEGELRARVEAAIAAFVPVHRPG